MMRIRLTEKLGFVLRTCRARMSSQIFGAWILQPISCVLWFGSGRHSLKHHVDVKTTDNYSLRMFCIAFTKRMPNQVKRTCYAQSSQIRQIRRKMREIMINQASSCDLKELVLKFIPEVIGKEIEKATTSIYPLQNVFIRKVKILKAPKFDLGKLMEVHGDYKEDIGVKLDRAAQDVPMEVEAEVVGA
ncbi:hypothetical protein KSP40_PGU012816 [Platanthera guangdongensis]|uniref:40S ribosomal protein S3a n=1 Tax=Platanthera guangdongensis TaxID=2320717 RepID=A0ABR2M3Q5_9ASPA